MNFDFDRFVPYFRRAGYCIFFLVLLDYAAMLVPAQLTNPSWELQTIGRLVEITWAPLLGGLLIFLPQASPQEFNFRFWALSRFFSWILLILAVLHILIAPLLVVNTVRIYRVNSAEFNKQALQLTIQLEEQTAAVENLSVSELREALEQSQQQQSNGQLPSGPEELRQEFLESLQSNTRANQDRLSTEFKTSRLQLFRQAIKWFIGTIIASILMFNVWALSRQSRQAWINLLEIISDI